MLLWNKNQSHATDHEHIKHACLHIFYLMKACLAMAPLLDGDQDDGKDNVNIKGVKKGETKHLKLQPFSPLLFIFLLVGGR